MSYTTDGKSQLSLDKLIYGINAQPIDVQALEKSFLIIYPRHPNRAALLTKIIEQLAMPVHYFALSTTEDTSIASFLQRLSTDPQFPASLGQQLRQALTQTEDTSSWAEAFGADLATLHRERYLLVLDQVDIVQSDPAFSTFFSSLMNYIPQHVQIVINGRELARHPWEAILEQGRGQVVGKVAALTEGIFNTPPSVGQIEFYAIAGRTRVLSDGLAVETWDGVLPRHLCYYFIEQKRVTRQEIFDVFWSGLGLKEATNVFHVTKRKISEKLGYEITDYKNGFYVPNEQVQIFYDAHEFEQAHDLAMTTIGTTALSHWYRAVHLYRHTYLPEVDMPWANAKREQLSNYYVQALLELGRYHETQNETEIALGYYLRAVHEKPEREDVHRNVMQLYHAQGRLEDALHQYQQLEKTLRRIFGMSPSKETRALYERLLKA